MNFEDKRPVTIAASREEAKAPVVTSESKALRESQGRSSWSFDTFKSFWERFPESSAQFLVNLDFLARPDFDWTALCQMMASDRELRPSRKELTTWSYIVEILRDKHAQKLVTDSDWIELTLQAPLPIGLRALFESRAAGETAGFPDALWDRILKTLTVPRTRALGSGVWLSFLTMIDHEATIPKPARALLSEAGFWAARRQESPDQSGQINTLLEGLRARFFESEKPSAGSTPATGGSNVE